MNEEPLEPEEGDLVTYDHREVWSFGGGKVLRVPEILIAEGEDFEKAVRRYMRRANWYPNVWFISDHGNAHLITL